MSFRNSALYDHQRENERYEEAYEEDRKSILHLMECVRLLRGGHSSWIWIETDVIGHESA